ncbi:unnamed protein product [Choristocarpus tenellus]
MDQELARLAGQLSEAKAEARFSKRFLGEKEAQLDAVTAQLMALKAELSSKEVSHSREREALIHELEAEKKGRASLESKMIQLEEEYSQLQDRERDKREAALIKAWMNSS